MSQQRGDEQSGEDEELDVDETAPPVPLAYATPGDAIDRFKTLRQMPYFEASLAAAKLEAVGIRSFVADQNISAAHPLLWGTVRLQVAEPDLQRAEEVLAQPSPLGPASEADERDDDDDDDYVEEEYRCPRCRRKDVELKPLSPAMRNTRFGCLLLFVLPIGLSVISVFLPGTRPDAGEAIPSAVWAIWVVVILMLSYIVLTAKRTKRCRGCGNEWGGAAG